MTTHVEIAKHHQGISSRTRLRVLETERDASWKIPSGKIGFAELEVVTCKGPNFAEITLTEVADRKKPVARTTMLTLREPALRALRDHLTDLIGE